MSPNGTALAAPPIEAASRKRKKRSIAEMVGHRPFEYGSSTERQERLSTILVTNGSNIPSLYLQIMFSCSATSIHERLRSLSKQRKQRAGVQLFAQWLKRDLIDDLTSLDTEERDYLRDLRAQVLFAYEEIHGVEVTAKGAALLAELRRSAKHFPNGVARVKCCRDECSNIFPRTADFFPGLRYGHNSHGACAYCDYLRDLVSRRNRSAFGPSRILKRHATEAEKRRFRQIESRVRDQLPTSALAAMFDLSSYEINKMRSVALTRKRGREIFRSFRSLEAAPAFGFLTSTENAAVTARWNEIRKAPKSGDRFAKRRLELRRYTDELVANNPATATKVCDECAGTFAANEHCFPFGRISTTGAKYLRKYCRPCYSEKYPRKV